MRLHRIFCTLSLCLLAPNLEAGSAPPALLYSELDADLSAQRPGRIVQSFDQSAAARDDSGVFAFSDEFRRITTVAKVDLDHADPLRVGIGLSRMSYYGFLDSTFDSDGKRVKDAYLTDVVDACVDPLGRIVVAGTAPGANGSGGNQDLALVRFNADGSDDVSFAGDGGVIFSFADATGEWPEAITDLDCLDNGNLLIGGWFHDSVSTDSRGFAAEMSATGSDLPVRWIQSASPAGFDHIVTMVEAVDGGIVQASSGTEAGNPAVVSFLSPSGATYAATSGRSETRFSALDPPCGGPGKVRFGGVAALAAGDYVLSGTREDGSGQRVGLLARVRFGTIKLVNCADVAFGVSNAYTRITPPVVLNDRIYVALGWMPTYNSPLTSRLRAFAVPADGTAPQPVAGFGTSGVAHWSYPYSTTQPGIDRSWVRHLYVDGDLQLMSVGTVAITGTDTDVALARFGSAGVFNHGFESD